MALDDEVECVVGSTLVEVGDAEDGVEPEESVGFGDRLPVAGGDGVT